ncbi:hypothetical protein FA95DRAFT_1612535 [Auriscalpium vulgare]|uniref:Uncharacterized protein n=1 Tax=Auriscalpium vulgare TaxID=40419 RepID=A0ACB8R5W2_9AGAM|nr:hypothetical protein FA95DRAFT_1612535 [Auriscalpium vulgare]
MASASAIRAYAHTLRRPANAATPSCPAPSTPTIGRPCPYIDDYIDYYIDYYRAALVHPTAAARRMPAIALPRCLRRVGGQPRKLRNIAIVSASGIQRTHFVTRINNEQAYFCLLLRSPAVCAVPLDSSEARTHRAHTEIEYPSTATCARLPVAASTAHLTTAVHTIHLRHRGSERTRGDCQQAIRKSGSTTKSAHTGVQHEKNKSSNTSLGDQQSNGGPGSSTYQHQATLVGNGRAIGRRDAHFQRNAREAPRLELLLAAPHAAFCARHPNGVAGPVVSVLITNPHSLVVNELPLPFPLPLTATSAPATTAGCATGVTGRRRAKGDGFQVQAVGGVGKSGAGLAVCKDTKIESDLGEIRRGNKRRRATVLAAAKA